MQPHPTPEEEEALFHAIIHKIPSILEADHLRELAILALALMLRRPEDRDLKSKLDQRLHTLFIRAYTPDAVPSEQEKAARFRETTISVIEILQEAKEHRKPRQTLHKSTRPKKAPTLQQQYLRTRKKINLMVTAAVSLMVGMGGFLLWYGAPDGPATPFPDAHKFSDQIFEMAAGGQAKTHLFGGRLEVVESNGTMFVVAEDVPPRICAAAGWALARKGVLSINGLTPSRISSAIITELCNSEDKNPTIAWTPKKTDPVPR